MDLKGLVKSRVRIHCPVQRIKVKKSHYKCILVISAAGIWASHHYVPDYEMHAAFLTNLLFAFDPTV